MKNATTRRLLVPVLVISLTGAGAIAPAHAAMIGTDTAIAVEQHGDRVARVQAKLARADLQAQFLAMGVAGEDVDKRLGALTDSELLGLERQIDALPAGGNALAVVGVVFLVLVILELIGVIDIFKKA